MGSLLLASTTSIVLYTLLCVVVAVILVTAIVLLLTRNRQGAEKVSVVEAIEDSRPWTSSTYRFRETPVEDEFGPADATGSDYKTQFVAIVETPDDRRATSETEVRIETALKEETEEEEVVIEEYEEAPAEEEKVEEPVTETVTEEKAEETPAEEEKAEETPAEEEKVEETVTETVTEEKAEETPAKKRSRRTVTEVVTEEVVTEEVVTTGKKTTVKKTATATRKKPAARGTVTVRRGPRYEFSFRGHLIRTTQDNRDAFADVRDKIYEYDKVFTRYNWNDSSVMLSGKKVGSFFFKNKSLYLALALDPAEFKDVENVEDYSGMKSFANLPTVVLLKGEGVETGKRLVEELFKRAKVGLRPKKARATARKYSYMSIQDLIDRKDARLVSPATTVTKAAPKKSATTTRKTTATKTAGTSVAKKTTGTSTATKTTSTSTAKKSTGTSTAKKTTGTSTTTKTAGTSTAKKTTGTSTAKKTTGTTVKKTETKDGSSSRVTETVEEKPGGTTTVVRRTVTTTTRVVEVPDDEDDGDDKKE